MAEGIQLYQRETPTQLFYSETNFLRTPTFKNICERLLLYLHVILFSMHEKDTANNAGLELSYPFFSKTVNDLLFPQKNCIIDI